MADGVALRDAVLLGAVHGVAELLPVSSSAHVALGARVLGVRLADDAQKALEVALHAGTLAGGLWAFRAEGVRPGFMVLSALPTAAAGFALRRPVERRLGGPRATAVGLVAGSAALLAADRVPTRKRPAIARTPTAAPSAREATAADALWTGVAQAAALWPGVSRNGATVATLRVRGFPRAEANALSRQAAVPAIAGATALTAPAVRWDGALLGGVAAAAAATVVARPLTRVVERSGRSVVGLAAYRAVLATATVLTCSRP